MSGRLKLAGLHPDVKRNAEWALAWADYYSVPVTVTSGFRSWAEQSRLRRNFEQCVATGRFGKAADCMFPANKPGDSSHNYGLSFDSTVPPWALAWWTSVRELAGFRVPPGDIVHAEVPSWRQYV
ncbi:MAG: hypothetical protein BMS9Abin29_2512 [Gemmatimonadota bacterium]|nr:MAG: hypothetical protein BMS9Abin29_2512 [Gemmatimonadota bacterium]